MRGLSSKRGISIIEYAVLIAIAVGALVCMQIYIKRGFEGRLRFASDQLSDASFYAPGETYTNRDTEINKNIRTQSVNYTDRGQVLSLGIGDHIYNSVTCIGGRLVDDGAGNFSCEEFDSPKPYLEIKINESIGPVS